MIVVIEKTRVRLGSQVLGNIGQFPVRNGGLDWLYSCNSS